MSHRCQSVLIDARGRVRGEVASVSHDFADTEIIPPHNHPEHQLAFASCGVMTIHTDAGAWVVPTERAVWIPAGTTHSISMSGRVSLRTVYVKPGLRRGLPLGCQVMAVSPLLRELILHACRFKHLRRSVLSQRSVIDLMLDQLAVATAPAVRLPQPSDARAVRVARAIAANPGDRRTLAALCRDCGASKRTVERLFLQETRMTFARWRQQQRLLHSMQRLASGDKVTTAALDAGYSSVSAFVSMFRKQLGVTPKRYFADI